MFDHGLDPAAALSRIDDWEQGFRQRAEQAQALATRTAGLSGTAHNANRSVEVTVDHQGQIVRLHLDDSIRGQSAAATAREIVAMIAQAKAALIHQFAEATAETVGADTATGQAMMAALRSRLGSAADD